MEKDIIIRPYEEKDCAALAALFYETVHKVNVRDYTEEQLNVWADGNVDLEAWNASFLAHTTVVAVLGEVFVGFGDMDAHGYLDRLFVHWAYQGRGIARAVCDALETNRKGRLTTHASVTAKPFFEKRGYRVVKAQEVERKGVRLQNFVMEKILP